MIADTGLKSGLTIILQLGIFLSIALVLSGGLWFLVQHGNEPLLHNAYLATRYDIDIITIWQSPRLFSPIGLIELGLLVLVAAQVLRVALLGCYYALIRDHWLMSFSFFILVVILYSLIWQ
tara:strand:+ start:2404 stop:2766 length:363 start_codon:yes stop_codon:yes gene_type:complete